MLSKIINKFKNINEFLIISITYLLITFFVWPFGEHSVNDDWQFLTHVRYFSEGNFVKNSLIDASFILQGFIGLGWSKVFGLSFVNLRILTIIFTIIFLYGVFKILKYYELRRISIYLVFLCIFIEPLFLTSSYSFMTEIYFLTFAVWSLYFYLKGSDNQEKLSNYTLIAITIASLTILIRQFGIVLFFSYLLLFLVNYKNKKLKTIYISILLTLFSATVITNFVFPQHSGNYENKLDKITDLVVNPKDFLEKFNQFIKYFVYISFYLAPIIFSIKFKGKYFGIFGAILSLFLAIPIFKIDIFDLKNVFHLECIYCETQFKHSTSIFDNIYFKYFISFLLSFGLVSTVLKIIEYKIWKKIKLNNIDPLLLISIGMLSVIFFVDSFYERYFINFAIFFIIYTGVTLNSYLNLNFLSIFTSFLFLMIIIFLNVDFYKSIEKKWSQSIFIKNTTGKNGEIFSTGSFFRYMNALENKPEDLKSSSYRGNYKCYVVRYITGEENYLVQKLNNQKLPKLGFIENPTFSNTGLQINIPKINKFSDKLIEVEEYFSPIYNILGRRTYILSFCEDEVTIKNKINFKKFE
jgi:hypothetical protein